MATVYNISTGDIRFINQFSDSIAIDSLGDSIIQIDDASYTSSLSTLPALTNTDFAIYTEIPKWQFFNGSTDWKFTVGSATDASGRITGTLIKDAHNPADGRTGPQVPVMDTGSVKFAIKNLMRTTRFAHFKQCSKFFKYSFEVGDAINVPVMDINGNAVLDASGVAKTRYAQLFGVYLNKFTGEALPYYTQTASGTNVLNYYYLENSGVMMNALNTLADSKPVTVSLDGSATPLAAVVPPYPAGLATTSVPASALTDTTLQNSLAKSITFELPPVAMTASATVVNIGNVMLDGTYVASGSSETVGAEAYRAFGKSVGNRWDSARSASNYYTAPSIVGYSGSTVITDTGSVQYRGEWVRLSVPTPVTIRSYTIRPVNMGDALLGPGKWTLLGSVNGSTWTQLDSRSGITWSSSGEVTYNVTNMTDTLYTAFTFVVENGTGSRRAMIASLTFTDLNNQQFPSAQLTGATTTLPEGTYTASSSSTMDNTLSPAYVIFRNSSVNSPTYWSSNTTYNWSGAAYPANGASITRDISGGTTVSGEYIQMYFPNPVLVTSYTIQATGLFSSPQDFSLWGSYNNNDWYLLDSRTGVSTWTMDSQPQTFTVSNPTNTNGGLPFNYVRLAVTRVSGTRICSISELRFNGTNTQFPQYRFPVVNNFTGTTATTTVNFMSSGTYSFSSSVTSSGTNLVQNVFNNGISTFNVSTVTGSSLYSNAPYIGTVVTLDASTGIAYSGEWLQMQSISGPLRVQSISFQFHIPKSYTLLGSNDGINWRFVDASSGGLLDDNHPNTAIVRPITTPSGGYSYYRFVTHDANYGIGFAKCNMFHKLTDMSGVAHPQNIASAYSFAASTNVGTLNIGNMSGLGGGLWLSATRYAEGTYSGSTTTTSVSGTIYRGEWIQAALPVATSLSSYSIDTVILKRDAIIDVCGNAIKSLVLLGSNNGTTWTEVDIETNINWASRMVNNGNHQPAVFTPMVSNPPAYKFYRIVITQCYGKWLYAPIPQIRNLAFYGRVTDRTIPGSTFIWSPPTAYSSVNPTYKSVMQHMSVDPSRALMLYWEVSPPSDTQYTGDEMYAAWSSVNIGTNTFDGSSISPVRDLDPSSGTYLTELAKQSNRFVLPRTLPALTVRQVRDGIRSQTLTTAAPRLNLPLSSYTVLQRINPTDPAQSTKVVPFAYEVANRTLFSASNPANTMLGGRLMQMLSHYLYNSMTDSAMATFTSLSTEAARITDAFIDRISTSLSSADVSGSVRRSDFLTQILARYGRSAFDEYANLSGTTNAAGTNDGNVREVVRNLDDIFINFAMSIDTRVSNRSTTTSDTIKFSQVPVIIRLTPGIFTDDFAPFLEFDANYVNYDISSNLISSWPNLAFPGKYSSFNTALTTATASGRIINTTVSGPVLNQIIVSLDGQTSLPAVTFNRDASARFVLPSINFNGTLASSGFTWVGVAAFNTPSALVNTTTMHESLFNFSNGAPTDIIRIAREASGTNLLPLFTNGNSVYSTWASGSLMRAAGALATPGQRRFFAFTFTPGTGNTTVSRTYVDNVLQATASGLNAITDRTTVLNYIGASSDPTHASFQGFIHQMQFYPRALSPAQISQLYTYMANRWALS